jgi:hypothetical protein
VDIFKLYCLVILFNRCATINITRKTLGSN